MYTKRVISCLKKRGVHVAHLYFYPHSTSSSEEIPLPFAIHLFKGFISFRSPFIFWNAIKNQDVVCINYPNIEAIPLIICALLQRKKIVTIFHCSIQIKNPILSVVLTPLLFFSLLVHFLASTSIISQEDYVSSFWWSTFFKNKYVYVDPPIDIPEKTRKQTKKIPNSVGFVGRISSEKGIQYLISALSPLKETHLYFIGPSRVQGESGYKNKILRLLEQNKIQYSFVSNPTDDELFEYITKLEMIVVPSINKTEAYGMVQPEAMVRGTPVIATDLPGVRIPIKKTHMGLLVPTNDVKTLSRAIYKIHNELEIYSNKELVQKAMRLFDPTKSLNIIYETLSTI